MNRPNVTYSANGIATIVSLGHKNEIDVVTVARLTVDGYAPAPGDLVALAAGYRAVAAERDALRAELAAARAGQVGVEHATAMQEARKVIAELRKAGQDFFEVYDMGDAPDSGADKAFRNAIGASDHWLLCDVSAAGVRAKVLKGGAQ